MNTLYMYLIWRVFDFTFQNGLKMLCCKLSFQPAGEVLKLSFKLCWIKDFPFAAWLLSCFCIYRRKWKKGRRGRGCRSSESRRDGRRRRENDCMNRNRSHNPSSDQFLPLCLFIWGDEITVFVQEEEERRAKEEQERREEEEYLRLKASFTIEDQGEEEQLTEDQVRSPTHFSG